jgi:pyruvate dehydrogenase E1 component alpha subunit/2-oxoisovalerate dehydrogenase E1 component alpha subunit
MNEASGAVEGEREAGGHSRSSLDADAQRALYTAMVRMRAFGDACAAKQRAGELDSYISAHGQEGVIAGAAAALAREDWIFPSAREHAIALARGVAPAELALQIFGRAGDPAKGRQAPCHVSFKNAHIASVSGLTGAHLPQAVGFAWAARTKKDAAVVVTFFGDGATSEGEFHSAMNFAGVMKPPVLFVCRNNGVALSTPLSRQTAVESLAEKGHGYGIPGVKCDGSDVLAVYEHVRAWVERARTGGAGGGPMLLEAVTADAASTSADRDPIAKLARRLFDANILSEDAARAIADEAQLEATRAVQAALEAPQPARETLFQDVFAQVAKEPA